MKIDLFFAILLNTWRIFGKGFLEGFGLAALNLTSGPVWLKLQLNLVSERINFEPTWLNLMLAIAQLDVGCIYCRRWLSFDLTEPNWAVHGS